MYIVIHPTYENQFKMLPLYFYRMRAGTYSFKTSVTVEGDLIPTTALLVRFMNPCETKCASSLYTSVCVFVRAKVCVCVCDT